MGKCVRKIDSLVLVWYVWHENVCTGIVSVRAFFVDFFLVFICSTVQECGKHRLRNCMYGGDGILSVPSLSVMSAQIHSYL